MRFERKPVQVIWFKQTQNDEQKNNSIKSATVEFFPEFSKKNDIKTKF